MVCSITDDPALSAYSTVDDCVYLSLSLNLCIFPRLSLWVSMSVYMGVRYTGVCAVTPHLVAPRSVITPTNAEYAWLYS